MTTEDIDAAAKELRVISLALIAAGGKVDRLAYDVLRVAECLERLERLSTHPPHQSPAKVPAPSCEPGIEGAGWRPISSAPKGEHLIVGDRENTVVAFWDERGGGFWASTVEDQIEIDFEPTHWMPLPPPPASRDEPTSEGDR